MKINTEIGEIEYFLDYVHKDKKFGVFLFMSSMNYLIDYANEHHITKDISIKDTMGNILQFKICIDDYDFKNVIVKKQTQKYFRDRLCKEPSYYITTSKSRINIFMIDDEVVLDSHGYKILTNMYRFIDLVVIKNDDSFWLKILQITDIFGAPEYKLHNAEFVILK